MGAQSSQPKRSRAQQVKEDYVVRPGSWRICDMPERLRPREEMQRAGAENVSDAVLLAVLLRGGTVGQNVMSLAERLLARYPSLTDLARCSVEELLEGDFPGLGPVKAQALKAALEIGRRMTREAVPESCSIRAPVDVFHLLREDARTLETEVFWTLQLDTKSRLKGKPQDVTHGLLDGSLVHAREVFREAVRASAASVVLAHNHPSGDPTPSAEDVRVTRQLVEAGRVVDIRVLDHVILGRESESRPRAFLSMREEGLVDFS